MRPSGSFRMNDDKARFQASIMALDSGVEAFYRGDAGAYAAVAVEVRRLLCDGDASLLPRVASEPVRLFKLHSTHVFEQSPSLADAHFLLPGRIGRSADGSFWFELKFAATAELMPLERWLQQSFIHPGFSIGEVITSVADAATANPAYDRDAKAKYDRYFNERLYPHCIVAIAEHLQEIGASKSGTERRKARQISAFREPGRTGGPLPPQAPTSPPLYRYLPLKYVDAFFADGSLRLSSFATFHKHADEERRDEKEGISLLVHSNQEGSGQTLTGWGEHGRNAYVLCGALRQDDGLMNDFQCDSYIQINDTAGFAQLVANQIAGFAGVLAGPCRYAQMRIIERDLGPIDPDSLSIEEIYRLANDQQKLEALFLKEQRYSHQAEYRILWLTSGTTEPFLDIKVPDAISLCSRPAVAK